MNGTTAVDLPAAKALETKGSFSMARSNITDLHKISVIVRIQYIHAYMI